MPMAAFKAWLTEYERSLPPTPEVRRARTPLHEVKHHESVEAKKRAQRTEVKAH
jgi:hypothetical protein